MLSHEQILSYLYNLPADHHNTAIMAGISKNSEDHYSVGIKGKAADEHPAANIMHAENKLKGNFNMYLTHEPSEIELGMMWRAKIKNAYYIEARDPLVIGCYQINKDGYHKLETSNISADAIQHMPLSELNEAYQAEPLLKEAMSHPHTKREVIFPRFTGHQPLINYAANSTSLGAL